MEDLLRTPETITNEINELTAPYLRIEQTPTGDGCRFWFGPYNFIDLDFNGFIQGCRRTPHQLDSERRIFYRASHSK